MKGLVIGDFLLPVNILERIFQGDGVEKHVTDFQTAEFEVESRSKIRDVWRQFEEHGPSGVPCPAKIAELMKDAEVLAVHICPVNKEMIASAQDLKIILSARGGLENIDVQEATKRKIPVIHTPNHNAEAVAEYTVGLILAETRNIARSHYALKHGKWQEFYPNSSFIPELNELKIGIVGYGANGQLVTRKLKAFNCEILVSDPFVPDEVIRKDGFVPLKLEELLKQADVISLHVRLTPKTANMIGEKEFMLMKPTAYLINCARAGLVDNNAMIQALKEKAIHGAAVDVYRSEPLPDDDPLLSLDNITLTNHRAGDTRNSYWNAPNLMRRELMKYFNGEKPRYLANKQVME
ncbi:MAG: 2-hydroxyacid dehydrogenase [Treponema sp.]|jgi:D-3-phosphoglycerate dehydrogenase|nr:2-hydroxyacid dehydrogenase [Treponema sp.]